VYGRKFKTTASVLEKWVIMFMKLHGGQNCNPVVLFQSNMIITLKYVGRGGGGGTSLRIVLAANDSCWHFFCCTTAELGPRPPHC